MAKTDFKPGNMLYPLPAVMVSCGDKDDKSNILTVAWAGTVCTNPPMVYISVRPERHSHDIIRDNGEFVINLTSRSLTHSMDYCGVRSGRDVDKWKECHLTKAEATEVKCPMIGESPVNIECKVTQMIKLGSHDMFLAKVVAVHVDDKYMDAKGTLHLNDANLIAYSHGGYYDLGKTIGSFGYSVRRKNTQKNSKNNFVKPKSVPKKGQARSKRK